MFQNFRHDTFELKGDIFPNLGLSFIENVQKSFAIRNIFLCLNNFFAIVFSYSLGIFLVWVFFTAVSKENTFHSPLGFLKAPTGDKPPPTTGKQNLSAPVKIPVYAQVSGHVLLKCS